jgi:ABC-2 type transport system permease protein
MAFSKITSEESFDAVDIAVVNDELYNSNNSFKMAIDALSDKKSDNQIFNTKYVTINKAKKLLNDKKIVGYIKINEDGSPNLTIRKNGDNETIVKTVLEEVSSQIKIVENIANQNKSEETDSIDYAKIYMDAYQKVNSTKVSFKNTSPKKMDYAVVEFYTLISMAALYGGLVSMFIVSRSLANMSEKGKRINISPLKKSDSILSGLLVSFIIQSIGMALLLLFTNLILKVDYGSNMLLVALIALIGTISGLSIGLFVGSVFKTSENNKMGIVLSVTMIGCFFAGMFGMSMKNIIDKNIPVINMVNPVALITDGLYSLYYYGLNKRYVMDIVYLLVISIILVLLSIKSLRRAKYDSI